MKLRAYKPEDLREILMLFYQTVHTVNARDYTVSQLDAWAPAVEQLDWKRWGRTLLEHDSLVAVVQMELVGFGDMDGSGHFDRLYVHRDHQGRGVASALADALEGRGIERGCTRFTTEASITARPFFEHRGYLLIRPQEVERAGIVLQNFVMEKRVGQ